MTSNMLGAPFLYSVSTRPSSVRNRRASSLTYVKIQNKTKWHITLFAFLALAFLSSYLFRKCFEKAWLLISSSEKHFFFYFYPTTTSFNLISVYLLPAYNLCYPSRQLDLQAISCNHPQPCLKLFGGSPLSIGLSPVSFTWYIHPFAIWSLLILYFFFPFTLSTRNLHFNQNY